MIPHNDFPLSSLVRKMQIFTKEVTLHDLDLAFFLRDILLDLPLIFLLWCYFYIDCRLVTYSTISYCQHYSE